MRSGRLTLPIVLLGALHALSFAPWALWWLQLLTMGGALALMLRDGWPKASQMAWFGLATFVAGLCWMFISMHRYGGMPAPMAALAVVLLSIYLCVYGAGAIALTRISLQRLGPPAQLNPWLLAATFGGWWSIMELARGLVFTGFPWLSIAYAHLDGPFAGWAPLLGVYGTGALLASCACLIASLAMRRDQLAAILAVPVILMLGGLALTQVKWAKPTGQALTVRLIQGNVPQATKFEPRRARQAIDDYIELVTQSDAQLNLLPETAWTVSLARTPRPSMDRLLTHLQQHNSLFAVGIPLRANRSGITNSVITLDGAGKTVNRYDKRHLVPFGEFVPPGFQWFVDMMHIPLGSFGRGRNDQTLLSIENQHIGFNICYEDLFGEELAVQVRQGATILANLSNLAWFGDSHALPQHLNLSRFRSIELARPMLRATNTGVTAHIDHRGRVKERIGHFEKAAVDVQVQGYSGLTPYARVGLMAPIVLALLLLLPAIATVALRDRQTRAGPPVA